MALVRREQNPGDTLFVAALLCVGNSLRKNIDTDLFFVAVRCSAAQRTLLLRSAVLDAELHLLFNLQRRSW